MMNSDAQHPLDRPGASDRLAALRVLCGGLASGLVAVMAIAFLIVQFALDGQPIAGNAVQVAGLSVVTWLALALAVTAPAVGLLISASVTNTGLARIASQPNADGPDGDRAGLLDVFATAKFAEFGVAESAGISCALLYHLTADAALIGAVVALVGFLALRFPTNAHVRRWYDRAADRLEGWRADPTR